jgi:4-carboxymuconolactone decarboxylase
VEATGLLCRAVAAAAVGQRARLGPTYRAALRAGAEPAALQEATLQVFLFAGYPRTIDAFEELAAVLGPAAPAPPREPSPPDLRARGREVFEKVYGPHAPAVLEKLQRLHPDFARFTLRDAYGQVLGRPFLPLAARELLAVAMLAALGCMPQLRAHVRGALRAGADAEGVRGALEAAEEAVGLLAEARAIVSKALAAPPSR